MSQLPARKMPSSFLGSRVTNLNLLSWKRYTGIHESLCAGQIHPYDYGRRFKKR